MSRPTARLLLFLLAAAPISAAQELKLIPEPRHVHRKEGAFTITTQTRIVATTAEDRVAAETLAEEIESAGGNRPSIRISQTAPEGANLIYLGRLGERASLDNGLASRNLVLDDAGNEEGYLLEVSPQRVIVAARTAAGVFYGAQTLRQLIQPGDGKRLVCPAVAIRDWPAMRWRGLHDDISRGPIPTMEFFKQQIRTLAEFRLNLFALYIEHVFDYQGHPLIAPGEAALTPTEIKELVEYAARYHVTVLPEQQAFGHLHHVLKYEVYAELAETPHGHVLAPVQEKSYELIRQLYAELVPLFPGPLFHIGADETFELGRGQTKARGEEIGLGRVYLEHVKRVAEMMALYRKQLLFWHDIAVKYPELLGILPKELVAVIWDYEPKASFEDQIAPFKKAGLGVFVAPGASNWNRIYPNLDAALVNIKNLVRDGQKAGALGMLNTTWDDNGEAIFGMTWPAVVFGAAAAWQPGESSIEAFQNKYDWAFYRHANRTFQDAITQLSRSHALLAGAGLRGANDDLFWVDPFTETGQRQIEKGNGVARELRLNAERALESLYRHRAAARAHADTIEPLVFAALRLDALGMKLQFAAEVSRFYWDAYLNQGDRARVWRNLAEISGINARLEDLRDSTTRLRGFYAERWLAENRPYWLPNVLVKYDLLAQTYQSKILAIKAAGQQFRDLSLLPPPQQLGLYIRP